MKIYNSKFYHGLMFHHFHDLKNYKKTQGSISKDELYKIIKFVGIKNILTPIKFIELLNINKLKKNHLCITFDDGLRSQYDIALPLLEDLNLKSFYFIHTSHFDGTPDFLEVFRYFRNFFYDNVDDFYSDFFRESKLNMNKIKTQFKENIKNNKRHFKFYSLNDVIFRIARDKILTKKQYESVMFELFSLKKFNYKLISKKLFFNKSQIKTLNELGHEIGLHSSTHPTNIKRMSNKDQKKEYFDNYNNIKKIINKDIFSMSHPCGRYNKYTLNLLKDLKLKIGFKNNMNNKSRVSSIKMNNYFEVSRCDNADILRMINK